MPRRRASSSLTRKPSLGQLLRRVFCCGGASMRVHPDTLAHGPPELLSVLPRISGKKDLAVAPPMWRAITVAAAPPRGRFVEPPPSGDDCARPMQQDQLGTAASGRAVVASPAAATEAWAGMQFRACSEHSRARAGMLLRACSENGRAWVAGSETTHDDSPTQDFMPTLFSRQVALRQTPKLLSARDGAGTSSVWRSVNVAAAPSRGRVGEPPPSGDDCLHTSVGAAPLQQPRGAPSVGGRSMQGEQVRTAASGLVGVAIPATTTEARAGMPFRACSKHDRAGEDGSEASHDDGQTKGSMPEPSSGQLALRQRPALLSTQESATIHKISGPADADSELVNSGAWSSRDGKTTTELGSKTASIVDDEGTGVLSNEDSVTVPATPMLRGPPRSRTPLGSSPQSPREAAELLAPARDEQTSTACNGPLLREGAEFAWTILQTQGEVGAQAAHPLQDGREEFDAGSACISGTLGPGANPHSEDGATNGAAAGKLRSPPRRRGVPPGPPPRSRRAASVPPVEATDAQAQLTWQGPLPPEGWKAQRVVNWQPIREPSRLQGSVWQDVLESAQERGFTALPDAEWTHAFMRRHCDIEPFGRAAVVQGKMGEAHRRLLSGRPAFQADLLHAQLVRLGFGALPQLAWILGPEHGDQPSVAEADDAQAFDAVEMPAEALEAFLGLLQAAEGREGQFVHIDGRLLPRSEELLGRVLAGGRRPLAALYSQVACALNVARFDVEAEELERQLRLGAHAAEAVLQSTALPLLLEGVLLLGNYVNASSRHLGGALAVTLDSLSKLSHTKCLPAEDSAAAANGAARSRCAAAPPSENALRMLARQLQDTHGPAFLKALISDLEGCLKARDLDPKALAHAVRSLDAQISATEQRVACITAHAAQCPLPPPALSGPRLQQFLAAAGPRTVHLKVLLRELDAAEEALQRYFAEPPSSMLPSMFANLAELRAGLCAESTSQVAVAAASGRLVQGGCRSNEAATAAAAGGSPMQQGNRRRRPKGVSPRRHRSTTVVAKSPMEQVGRSHLGDQLLLGLPRKAMDIPCPVHLPCQRPGRASSAPGAVEVCHRTERRRAQAARRSARRHHSAPATADPASKRGGGRPPTVDRSARYAAPRSTHVEAAGTLGLARASEPHEQQAGQSQRFCSVACAPSPPCATGYRRRRRAGQRSEVSTAGALCERESRRSSAARGCGEDAERIVPTRLRADRAARIAADLLLLKVPGTVPTWTTPASLPSAAVLAACPEAQPTGLASPATASARR